MNKFHITYKRIFILVISGVILFPIIAIKIDYFKKFTIQERIVPVTRPSQLWKGVVKHEWQAFAEQQFLSKISNFRIFAILLYNEIKHKLFRYYPNNAYVYTLKMGYYPIDTIQRLNYDILNRDAIKSHYEQAAGRLRNLQRILQNHGITLLMVPAPTKARIYPEYIKSLLISPPEKIINQVVSYGEILEINGVNVLNTQRILTDRKKTSLWPFFTPVGFHWSYWTGSMIADEILKKAELLSGRKFFSVDYATVSNARLKWADTDIAMILNIFSSNSIIGTGPFPVIQPSKKIPEKNQEILVIGDSFSDQIAYAFIQALPEISWEPGWLTVLDLRSKTIRKAGLNGELSAHKPIMRDSMLQEIFSKQLLILEVSDAHIVRPPGSIDDMEFRATRILLEELLPTADVDPVDLRNLLINGWKKSDADVWYTTNSSASFVVRTPVVDDSSHLILDLEKRFASHTQRILKLFINNRCIDQIEMTLEREIIDIALTDNPYLQDDLVTEISISAVDGKPLDMLLHTAQIVDKKVHKNTGTASVSELLTDIFSKKKSFTDEGPVNLVPQDENDNIVITEGLSATESNSREKWRWALGPKTRIKFYIAPGSPILKHQLISRFTFKNDIPIPGQDLTVRLNGEKIHYFSSDDLRNNETVNAYLNLNVREGVNVFELVYKDWNHGKKVYAPHDPRQLAVVITQFTFEEIKH